MRCSLLLPSPHLFSTSSPSLSELPLWQMFQTEEQHLSAVGLFTHPSFLLCPPPLFFHPRSSVELLTDVDLKPDKCFTFKTWMYIVSLGKVVCFSFTRGWDVPGPNFTPFHKQIMSEALWMTGELIRREVGCVVVYVSVRAHGDQYTHLDIDLCCLCECVCVITICEGEN